jgi:hypothetical protein
VRVQFAAEGVDQAPEGGLVALLRGRQEFHRPRVRRDR